MLSSKSFILIQDLFSSVQIVPSHSLNHPSEEILKSKRSENFRRPPGTHTCRGSPLIKLNLLNEPKLTKGTRMSLVAIFMIVVLYKKCSENIFKFHRKTPVLESFVNKVFWPIACNFIKKGP